MEYRGQKLNSHLQYLYLLGFANTDINLLQESYRKKESGELEQYRTFVSELKNKFPDFNDETFEELVKEGSRRIGKNVKIKRFVSQMSPYVVAGRYQVGNKRFGFTQGRRLRATNDNYFIPKKIWDTSIKTEPEEYEKALEYLNEFRTDMNLSVIKLEDLPGGQFDLPILFNQLKVTADRPDVFSTGNIIGMVSEVIAAGNLIKRFLSEKVPAFGTEEVNNKKIVSELRKYIKQKINTNNISKNFNEGLRLVFTTSVVKQLPKDTLNALNELMESGDYAGKPVGYWLAQLATESTNLPVFGRQIEVSESDDLPFYERTSPVTTGSKGKDTYAQRRKRERKTELVEGQKGTIFTGKETIDTQVIDGKRVVIDSVTGEPKRKEDGSYVVLKMDVEDLPPKTRKKVKTYMQDADPTEYFGEEYLKLGKVINILEGIVDAEDEEELAELSEDNLKMVKLAARLRKHYETLYRALDDMVYDNKEEEE